MSAEPSLIEQAIIEHWGERCPEYEPGCHTCEAWKEYDAMTQQNQSPVVTDEELYRWLYPYVGDDGLTRILIQEMRTRLEAALSSGVRVSEKWLEEGPNLGASSNEPGLREILMGYYLPFFEETRAKELVEAYITALPALEPTQSQGEGVELTNDRLKAIAIIPKRADLGDVSQMAAELLASRLAEPAPAPVELAAVAMVVCHDETLEVWELEDADLKEGEELCRLTDAQAALTAVRAEQERLERAVRWWEARTESAEARVAELEKALERIASTTYPTTDTIYAHRAVIDYARDQARTALQEEEGENG